MSSSAVAPARGGALAVVLTAAWVLLGGPAQATYTLQMPPQLRRAGEQIARQCPECMTTGFLTCGTADVAYGKRFARTALQGRPPRGYLVSFVMSGNEFRDLARRTPYEPLVATLRERFTRARLVILEAPGARVLPPPDLVRADVPPPLHACVHGSSKPWGCCVAANCHDECCEKALGSPTVTLTWTDPQSRDATVLTFHHATGFSRLEHRGRRGSLLYYCLVDGPARIAD